MQKLFPFQENSYLRTDPHLFVSAIMPWYSLMCFWIFDLRKKQLALSIVLSTVP